MRNKMKIVVIIIALIIISTILTWSPWLDEKEIHDRVLKEMGRIDRTINEEGNLVCDYKVMKAPFGRWVASCEGGYYVTFWGEIR